MKSKLNLAAAAGFDSLPDAAFVRLPAVLALYGISQPTCWRWVALGKLPAPRKLGQRVSGFQVGELRRSLATLAESQPRTKSKK